MDVRIGYSVDLDSVPDKMAEMLSELSTHKAAHLMKLAMHMIELGHHEMGLTLIDDSRKALSDVDKRLGEAHSILTGYTDAIKQLEPEPLDATGDEDVVGNEDAD